MIMSLTGCRARSKPRSDMIHWFLQRTKVSIFLFIRMLERGILLRPLVNNYTGYNYLCFVVVYINVFRLVVICYVTLSSC